MKPDEVGCSSQLASSISPKIGTICRSIESNEHLGNNKDVVWHVLS